MVPEGNFQFFITKQWAKMFEENFEINPLRKKNAGNISGSRAI